MRRFEIDLNRRVRGSLSPARFESAPPPIGASVIVFESEDEVEADGVVVDVIPERNLVLIDVAWSTMRDERPEPSVHFSWVEKPASIYLKTLSGILEAATFTTVPSATWSSAPAVSIPTYAAA